MAAYSTQNVIEVRHWSDKLFSFTTTRNDSLRFDNGQFIMLGLEVDGRRLVRAYSIASANHEEHLEFYSIKVQNGPLTSRLQHIAPGSPILMSSKPTGTLVVRDLKPGRRLILLATGTGVAPFMGIARDPETYERFEQVILLRGASTVAGLAYADASLRSLYSDPYLGGMTRAQLHDYPMASREPHPHRGRITDALDSGQMFRDLGQPALDPTSDRFMICGSMRMLADVERLLEARGLTVSPQIGVPGDFVIERAFVESFEVAEPKRNTA